MSKSTDDKGPHRQRDGREGLILLTFDNDGRGQRLKRAQIPNLPAISKPKPRTVMRFGALSFPGLRLGLTQMVERPRSNARRATKRELAHISAKCFLAPAPSVFGALFGVSLGKFLNDEQVDSFFCWSCFLKSKK